MYMKSVTLTITIDQDGSVKVSGPLSDKLFCYGLLEMARDSIREFESKPASDIVVAPAFPGMK